MAVLSNTCAAHWDWILKQDWDLPGDWFDFHVLSYEVRSMKPDAGIYEECENRSGCRAAEIFFTDDREENCKAASERGWVTYLYRSASELSDSLHAWLAN